MYRCPCCGEPAITFGQKVWVSYVGRSATCRNCGGSVGIPSAVRYLTNAPMLLYILGLYLYLRSLTDEQLHQRETFWLFVVGILVVPPIYGVLVAAFRFWFAPLARR